MAYRIEERFAMKKFWNWLVSFFGFGEEELTKKEKLDRLLNEIGSQEKLNECKQMAFQVIQKKDPIQPGKPHPYEATIKGDCIIADAALTDYHNEELNKSFGDAQYLITLIENGIGIELSNSSPKSVKQKITGQIALATPEVEKLKKDLAVAQKDLDVFKGANGLGAAANYPESRSNSLYFIVGAAILEALFNIAFLREQLDGHIALFVAIAVAAMNVGVNVWFGIEHRLKNHIDAKLASKGRMYKLYAAAAILFLNSFIAYIRYSMLPEGQDVNAQFFLESGVLFLVGIILGVAAFNKGYALDDPYPDYGRLSRKVDYIENDIKHFAVQHADFCEATKKQATTAHQTLKQRIHASANSLSMTLPEMSKKLHEWSAQRNQLNHVYSQLQEIFRGIIVAFHPDSEGYPVKVQELSPNTQLESHQTQVDNFIAQKEQIDKAVDELVKQVDESDDQLHSWLVGSDAAALWRWPN
jgi:hypothetical protein